MIFGTEKAATEADWVNTMFDRSPDEINLGFRHNSAVPQTKKLVSMSVGVTNDVEHEFEINRRNKQLRNSRHTTDSNTHGSFTETKCNQLGFLIQIRRSPDRKFGFNINRGN